MDLQRIGIKFFFAEPDGIRLRDFVPIFHSWIQNQSIAGHQLVDVHDYSHIHNGPGILLVAFEGNISIDGADGRTGLLYCRKQPLEGALNARLAAIAQTAVQARRLLEENPGVRFRADELLIVANDRLQAPNDDTTLAGLQPALEQALGSLSLPTATFTRISANPKERFAVKIVRGGLSAPHAGANAP